MAITKSLALLALSGLSSFGFAAPLEVRDDTVSTDVFEKLSFFEQYAAAAYCQENNNSTDTKVTCSEKNCDSVEAADTNTLTEFENSKKTDATGFVTTDSTNKLIVLAFRGSKSIDNWAANLDFQMEDVSFCSDCRVHSGFLESWNEVQDGVINAVKGAQAEFPDFKVVATGHSLGGAVATIAAAALRTIDISVDLYTYGAPKSGNDEWAEFLGSTDKGMSFRVVHKHDLIPTLPPSIPFFMPYAHVQPEYYITTDNNVEVTANDIKVVPDGDDGGIDIASHLWYFNHISACDGLIDMKVKRMIGSDSLW
ncbi:alpha/beta-hydrolase [Bimuria novae-zelandiae CBS 107.79]|uniref:Alpha/beta-hydrolase n=1 Tax=Bimuria novae-zelandiae CBS 107.79 TaxID=1447943 RepID=A0A6A5UWP4_9PLEO|nr:alpha/beta-hydrolase [Bimuria novae-zelandiae CBS 107.79]